MNRNLKALPLAALAVLGLAAPQASAQDHKARGVLINMSPDSISVKVGTAEMKFAVDTSTRVEAPGAGTQARKAAATGQPGLKLSEVVRVGDAVEVTYSEAGGRHASLVRKVSTPGSGGVPGNTSSGTVTAVSASSLSIEGSSGGGGKFAQTFSIDEKTNVVAKGASTKSSAAGGRTSAADLVGKGDHVNVSFSESGGSLHATEIRVMSKAVK